MNNPGTAHATSFAECGYAVLNLSEIEIVKEAASAMQDELRRISGDRTVELTTYHESRRSEADHERILIELTAWFRDRRIVQTILERNIASLMDIVGADLKIERNPFIRLNRPGIKADNLGYHRDTFYGASPFEMSCIVPFVPIPKTAALRIVPGSHTKPDSAYEILEAPSRGTHVVRGSPIHKVGFPYAPRVVSNLDAADARPVPLDVGQILVFTIACIHGSSINSSNITRVSSDCRVVNALLPLERNILINGQEVPYYEDPIRLSPLTACGMAHQIAAKLG